MFHVISVISEFRNGFQLFNLPMTIQRISPVPREVRNLNINHNCTEDITDTQEIINLDINHNYSEDITGTREVRNLDINHHCTEASILWKQARQEVRHNTQGVQEPGC
jgi:hypothetical protein